VSALCLLEGVHIYRGVNHGTSDTAASQPNAGKGIENTNCQRNYNRTIISGSVLVLRVASPDISWE
jgi:hypothetical protein